MSSRGARRRRRSTAGRRARIPTLERHARQAVHHFVRVFAHCGCPPLALKLEVNKACRRIPKSWGRRANLRDSLDPGHVMTLWFSDPACLDAFGRPRALPLRGSPISLETLTHRIDPGLDVRDAVRYLEQGGALKRRGTRYLPRDRVLILRGRERMTPFLRGLFGLLKTLDHNRQVRGRSPGWLEKISTNPRIPVSAKRSFEMRARKLIDGLLVKLDADMHRLERAARKGERTVRMGFGAYQFEEGPTLRRDRLRSGRRSRSRRRARR